MSKKANFEFMVVAIIVVLMGTGSAWADITDGLVAHWTFDEGSGNVAFDSFGTNHANLLNGPTWTSGYICKGINFDGSNDYAQVDTAAGWENIDDPCSNVTIAAWIKKPSQNSSWDAIVSTDAFRFEIVTDRQIHWGWTDDSTSDGSRAYSSSAIPLNQWVHVAATKYGNEIRFYIDGNLKDIANINGRTRTINTIRIGGDGLSGIGGMDYFNGIIDDLRIYERALSAEEVAQLYCGEETNLVSIEILGPDEIAENFQAQYKAIAFYDNNSTEDITDLAVWSVEPDLFAAIDAGLLNTDKIDFTDENITISAQYTEGNDIFEADKEVTIFAICHSGSALDFDGVNDYVNCGINTSLEPANLTIAAWFKTQRTSGNERIVSKLDRDSDNKCYGYELLLRQDMGNKFHFQWFEGTVGGRYISSTSTFQTDTRYFMAATFDDTSKEVNLYINGIKEANSIATGSIAYQANWPLSIGRETEWETRFHGVIDEVTIYNRALSAEEIRDAMYNRADVDDPNLVAYWDFDEGEGQVAYDVSGNGNNGTLGSNSDADGSDPNWTESIAPVGICTPRQIVHRNISDALELKSNIQHQLDVALRKEQAAKSTLDQIGKECPKGNKNWLLKAKLNLLQAIWKELWSQRNISESMENLEKVTVLLDNDNTESDSGK